MQNYKISQAAVEEVINILAGSAHPTLTFNQINSSIGFLQKLEQIVEPVEPTPKKK